MREPRIDDDYSSADDEPLIVGDLTSPETDFAADTDTPKIADKSYVYRAVDSMQQNRDVLKQCNKWVFILYRVNLEGKAPFLEFGLNFSSETHKYHFIETTPDQIFDIDNMVNVKGYIQIGEVAYIFYETGRTSEIQTTMSFLYSSIHFLLADELINDRRIFKCKVDDAVSLFFKNYPDTLFLYSSDNSVYELPSVGYVGGKYNNIRFLSTFGSGPSEISAPFGVGYYFTNYENALQHSKRGNVAYLNPGFSDVNIKGATKGVVCRFAIFPGRTKVILNKPDDAVDESDMKKQLLKSSETKHKATMTMRITDHDALWTKTHSSVFTGKIDYDDGGKFQEGPLWVLRDHVQQLFLTYQMAD